MRAECAKALESVRQDASSLAIDLSLPEQVALPGAPALNGPRIVEAAAGFARGLPSVVDKLIETTTVLGEADRPLRVALFGRTKVGKSTLIEILTDGDRRAIGDGAQRKTRIAVARDWGGSS